MESKDVILTRMLGNISDEYDKAEGSFFYDAEKPVAIEAETLHAKADAIQDKCFADTATGADLDRKCADQGIERKPATKATGTVTITGTIGATVPLDGLVASDNVEFKITQSGVIPAGGSLSVTVECLEEGQAGNVPAGAIKTFPITIEGLVTVTNAAGFTSGYDAESDESLRARYYAKVRTPATSGNKYHYRNWALEVTGVGDARIVPLWNGPGTVKAIIINSNKQPADSTLVNSVATHIEDVRPIGAAVTVVSAAAKAINISVSLTLDTGYTTPQVKLTIEANITQHLKNIAFVNTYVSYAMIGAIILDSAGVLDYSGLTINGGTANVSILDSEVATLGNVTVL